MSFKYKPFFWRILSKIPYQKAPNG